MFNSDTAIFEWMPDDGGHNFGDFLMQLIGEAIFLPKEWLRLQSDSSCKYVLLGSFICDYTLNLVTELNKRPVIVGCGYRGEVLSPRLASQTTFLGCRGKHSAEYLADVGVAVDWIGDPAEILPLLVKKKRGKAKESIFMPHINDPVRLAIAPTDVGCDRILHPAVLDMVQLNSTIRKISGASFVLAGAMHAAIIAYAYGVPFAFYATKGGYVDCPPKWADWLSSISCPYVPPAFFPNADGGKKWYRENQRHFRKPRYVSILNQYALLGRLRRSIVWRAVLHDAWHMYAGLKSAVPMTFKAPVPSPKNSGLTSGHVVIDSTSDLFLSRKSRRSAAKLDRL